MAYHELVKTFGRIRSYLRSFYVYGFRHRNDYEHKHQRSYDNERRRVESWLGDYMSFGQDKDGRRFFISVDSRAIPENPLYRAFKTKSFTEKDIMLHFHLLDILTTNDSSSTRLIMEELEERLYDFGSMPDESTVREKLNEYVGLGLILRSKQGREILYSLSSDEVKLSSWEPAVSFFSEASPLGVVGSFILDRMTPRSRPFRFKHHYILNALDSEILRSILTAITDRHTVTLSTLGKSVSLLPLKLYVGTQTGRQYLLAWSPDSESFSFYRADLIDSVRVGSSFVPPEGLEESMREFCAHVWGVSPGVDDGMTHIAMTVHVGEREEHIVQRLEREKRCGQVERVDSEHWRFTADVLDALEMLPWLRTFIGRITELQCSDEMVIERFREDIRRMSELYAVQ